MNEELKTEDLGMEDDLSVDEDLYNDFIDLLGRILDIDSEEEAINRMSQTKNIQLVQLFLRYKSARAMEDLAEAIATISNKDEETEIQDEPEKPAITNADNDLPDITPVPNIPH